MGWGAGQGQRRAGENFHLSATLQELSSVLGRFGSLKQAGRLILLSCLPEVLPEPLPHT